MEAATFTAKYRDGEGIVREVATGCRDEQAARSVLARLERRAELVKSDGENPCKSSEKALSAGVANKAFPVERKGVEPSTSALRTQRSPN
jgi:hypothetical protein